uniref:Uncharacterized protein n=1 Tax=Astyanax mexicanus TaxID=7994 RepID=A0A3B1JC24_ASTMX
MLIYTDLSPENCLFGYSMSINAISQLIIVSGSSHIVQLLLQHMADPDASTTNGYTPLHIAAREVLAGVRSRLQINNSHLLMDKKLKGFTPLHVAAKYGSLEVAKLLLQRRALPDEGVTPLHLAAQEGHAILINTLFNKYSLSLFQSGLTPLHLAAQEDRVNAAEVLVKHGANLDHQTKVRTRMCTLAYIL